MLLRSVAYTLRAVGFHVCLCRKMTSRLAFYKLYSEEHTEERLVTSRIEAKETTEESIPVILAKIVTV